jgi:hypothetical protein
MRAAEQGSVCSYYMLGLAKTRNRNIGAYADFCNPTTTCTITFSILTLAPVVKHEKSW